ncbi:MAG TPA: ribonuclease J [Spirochaetota bacterium]|nr:ribonuclease J [Spirochaetota bacterium]
MKKKEQDKVKILSLGGLGAVGGNMMVMEYRDEMMIIDCGIMFPSDDMPGVDLIIPDFSYVIKNRKKLKAIVVTHGHEDHIGAIPFLLQEINAPIYATKLTIGLIQSRLAERKPREEPVFIEIVPRDLVHIGSMAVEFIRVNHSIIDGVGLAIKTPVGTIIHSGDFKIDHSPVDGMVADLHRFGDYGQQGVQLLLSDSTNAERKGYTRSESVLRDKLVEIFSGCKGRIIVATFASNIHRIQQVLDAASRYNRKVVVTGMTMLKNIEIATQLGYLNYKEGLIIDTREMGKYTNKRMVVICTGTQGEPMSALSRMAGGTHKYFRIGAGDTVVITASVIPGNERMVNKIINSLLKMKADVHYEQDEDIHVSGHGSQEELKLLMSLTRPKYFMPIHGEYKHLRAHAKLAESLGIKSSHIVIGQTGDVVELTRKKFEKSDTLNLPMVYIDGSLQGDVTQDLIEERKTLSSDGVVIVTSAVSEGMMMSRPEVFSRGFVGQKGEKVIHLIQRDAEQQMNRMLADGASLKQVQAGLKKTVKNTIYKHTRRNPVIEVTIVEI